MFSWEIKTSVESSAKPQSIWKLWSNVHSWPLWDEGLEWCKLEGDFTENTKGVLKPKGWCKTPFLLTRVEPNQGFRDCTKMPWTTIEFEHKIEKKAEGRILVTHRVIVKGLFAPLLRLTMGSDLKKGLPKTVKRLTEFAEKQGS
ncbi:MAG: hypothetical protein HKM07_07370 [Chlamydiae bacterium]|nr:hypothetical protein [Chlamydiota bacterium]